MSPSKLPERASLEYLKKLAKDRLHVLRHADPRAKLATALFEVAQEYGFSSWRALKAELEQRQKAIVVRFFEACAAGDVEALRDLLASDPGLARLANPAARHAGWTGLHTAAQQGHVAAVRMLLGHGADVNAREAGDNTYPLHWAAAHGHLETVRTLLDAGGEVHGLGDVHEQDVIGWASHPDSMDASQRELVASLVERGARHHIFSAMASGDLNLIQQVVEQNPEALDRRMSRFEQGRTAVHEAIERKRYDILDLLIELGADVDATDMNGRTPMAVAMLKGDREAMTRLHAAGAAVPAASASSTFTASMARLADHVQKLVPMIHAPDVVRTLDWYKWLGFRELTRYDEDGDVNFGMVAFGKAEIMLNQYGDEHHGDVSLWFYTDRVDELYQLLKSKQIEAARAVLAGETESPKGIEFEADIEDMFYGARQFSIRDPNGYSLTFIQGR